MKRLLVANRGEIAVRVLSAARELNICAVAIFAGNDTSHVGHANEAYELSNAASFLDIEEIIAICKERGIDTVHPGYGFLSESTALATRLDEEGITFVGPSSETLKITGDKSLARNLAATCDVPVLPALKHAVTEPSAILSFAESVGYPVMLKAVDGGGGRGIRLVRTPNELRSAFERAQAESASKYILAEKAVAEGWRHIEVQILGDGRRIRHFWERECSIQRRFQKIVELAPSMIISDTLRANVIESALRIAQKLRYKSLGTFEFLVFPEKNEFYFIEINPRLQVEHTVTETIACTDLVHLQLQIASGCSMEQLDVEIPDADAKPPNAVAIQFRVTAEDPKNNFALSVGRINKASWPSGSGVRVDTHTSLGTIITSDFDSLLAKIIIYGSDYNMALRKSLRALSDTAIDGITTNLDLLQGIALSEAFKYGHCDIKWLEKNIEATTRTGLAYRRAQTPPDAALQISTVPLLSPSKNEEFSVKRGDSWHVSLTDARQGKDPSSQIVRFNKVMRNDFPHSIVAEISISSATFSHADSSMVIRITQASAESVTNSSKDRKTGSTDNPDHLICPISGTLVEVLVNDGDEVEEYEPVVILRQMKMELEIRAHRSGRIEALWDAEDGENIAAGTLVCEIIESEKPREKL